ncbi:hypothetical protein EDEG_00748 [Edhazardia aedis USNM 41457]|uniref:Uncharacterized protein n=1 Tax=Edhazardia aedis (strain USNM 41457) TaxID=1003232 RepID=J9DV50_EDHAE|nr:hypothetical protein EDEG_00748 [Edhazardia aedis USNM 41457]|eukprot:EJW05167.1 hypothetical protein EDEG_00748 [Edhazardia aedis USNM 41457]
MVFLFFIFTIPFFIYCNISLEKNASCSKFPINPSKKSIIARKLRNTQFHGGLSASDSSKISYKNKTLSSPYIDDKNLKETKSSTSEHNKVNTFNQINTKSAVESYLEYSGLYFCDSCSGIVLFLKKYGYSGFDYLQMPKIVFDGKRLKKRIRKCAACGIYEQK